MCIHILVLMYVFVWMLMCICVHICKYAYRYTLHGVWSRLIDWNTIYKIHPKVPIV